MLRKLSILAASVSLLLAVIPGASASVQQITVGDNFYDPNDVEVETGTTVEWRHTGGLPHSVTADDGSFDSHPGCSSSGAGCMMTGGTFSHTFSDLGAFSYHCKVHPGMEGTVRVVPAAGPAPTTVDTVSAAASGDAVQVSGDATFGGEFPVLIGTDATGDPPVHPSTAQFGVDLVSIWANRPNPNRAEVQFTWKVTQLDAEPPPEIVRYLWQMRVNSAEYWVTAKTTDLLSGTNVLDDPAGHATNVQGAFKLRGNCGPIVSQLPNVTTCGHISFVDGEFDPENNEIRLRVPLGTAMAPQFVPGATIAPHASQGNAEAGFQVALSNPNTADQLAWDTQYTIADKGVRLGIAPAGTPEAGVSFNTVAALGEGDSFSGGLSTAGLSPGDYDVWARACFGTNCGAASTTITIG